MIVASQMEIALYEMLPEDLRDIFFRCNQGPNRVTIEFFPRRNAPINRRRFTISVPARVAGEYACAEDFLQRTGVFDALVTMARAVRAEAAGR